MQSRQGSLNISLNIIKESMIFASNVLTREVLVALIRRKDGYSLANSPLVKFSAIKEKQCVVM